MNLTRAEARERAELIAVDSYEVSLDLTRGEKVFGSTTAVVDALSRSGWDGCATASNHTVISKCTVPTASSYQRIRPGDRVVIP